MSYSKYNDNSALESQLSSVSIDVCIAIRSVLLRSGYSCMLLSFELKLISFSIDLLILEQNYHYI